MLGVFAKRLFGTHNDRFLKRLQPEVEAINALEPELEALSDEALRARTDAFRERLAAGAELDSLLVEAFATVREAARRTLGQRHFDVQLMGGIVLHRGMIAEMKTGEGKTLAATLPVYLNALAGRGVHVVTVNDYLAARDAEWMGRIYGFLGLTVGCITHGLPDTERRRQYAADVTYGTNNELGFDYLRDNMKFALDEMVQRDFAYAIVDEVDSILIDEARTPLIISGAAEQSSELYQRCDRIMAHVRPEHYEKDEKQRTVALNEAGQEHGEALLREHGILAEGSLYDIQNISLLHHLNQALRAHTLFERDVDYMVRNDQVVIIDEFTGRAMEGRRYSEGLHQALEAKEGVTVQLENQTLAQITFQNYFRLYDKLAGMTGTAMTEAGEFEEIYGLQTVEIPTNLPTVRADHDDEVYRTAREKNDAILAQIRECVARRQPVLVGTVSIEKSEELGKLLKREKIGHQILNARYHEQEAAIIAQAGKPGAVTIATNMAGRGTDIQLGGNAEMLIRAEGEARAGAIQSRVEADREVVLAAGGLYVLATERHESRRIDNQLRGRSGRQGDPGASKFFVSLEDDLMRIFGSERMDGMLRRLGLEEGEAIVHSWINKALEKAQQKVEARNFDIRKNLLKFDDVMNDQRKVIYEQRRDLMQVEDVHTAVTEMREQVVEDIVHRFIPEKALPEQWDAAGLEDELRRVLAIGFPAREWADEEGIADEEICRRILASLDRRMAEKAANWGADVMRQAEKSVLLQLLDQIWKEHLLQLDHLRQGIGLRAYAQKDPLNEYKQEAFALFDAMLARLREAVTGTLAHLEVRVAEPSAMMPRAPEEPAWRESHEAPEPALVGGGAAPAPQPVRRAAARQVDPADPSTWGKVARNAPCPCGSGKKYKHCHGRLA